MCSVTVRQAAPLASALKTFQLTSTNMTLDCNAKWNITCRSRAFQMLPLCMGRERIFSHLHNWNLISNWLCKLQLTMSLQLKLFSALEVRRRVFRANIDFQKSIALIEVRLKHAPLCSSSDANRAVRHVQVFPAIALGVRHSFSFVSHSTFTWSVPWHHILLLIHVVNHEFAYVRRRRYTSVESRRSLAHLAFLTSDVPLRVNIYSQFNRLDLLRNFPLDLAALINYSAKENIN